MRIIYTLTCSFEESQGTYRIVCRHFLFTGSGKVKYMKGSKVIDT